MSLKNVYHYDGVTKTSILSSVVKLTAKQGVYPDFGGLSVDLTYPVLDASGNEVTLEKGDLIWASTEWSVNQWFTYGLGIINDIKRSGDLITVKAESMLEPLMRMRYTVDNSLSGFVTARIWDIITKYTPPHGIAVSSWFLTYRKETGSSTWNLDTTMSKVVHGMDVDVKAYFQYLIEQPVNLWLEKPTGTIFPVYEYNDTVGMPSVKVGFSGYGNHRASDKVLSHSAGVLSKIEWQDPTDSVLNDVTITVRGGGKEQLTDATSIAAYGKRQTSLVRGIYTEDAIGGYDATWSLKSIVGSMKDPHKRCRLTCEMDALVNDWQTVGGMFRVIDELTGRDEYMALRSFTYRYPEEIAECEFDNAPLDMSKYGMRMENRVTSLESNMVTAHAGFFDLQGGISPTQYYHLSQAAYNNLYQQDQAVKTTDSPSFASPTFNTINISGSYNQIRAPLKVAFRNADNSAYMGLATKEIYIGDLLFADESKNVYANSLITGLIKPADTSSVDGVAQFAFNGANRGWLRFRRGGSNQACGVLLSAYDTRHFFIHADGDLLKIDYNGSLNHGTATNALSLSNGGGLSISGDYYGGRIYLTSGANATDMGSINNTSATADDRVNISINRTNQTGTTLYLSIYDAKNGTFGGVHAGTIRLNGSAYCYLTALDYGLLNIQTSYGYLKMGPNNTDLCHFYTDRAKYYFNKGMNVTGAVIPYSTNTYDLGSYAQKWRDLYLGGSCSIAQNLTVSGDVAGSGVVAALALGTRTMSASSTVQFNNSTYKSTTTTSSPGTMVKQLKVNYAMTGTFYIKWSLVSQGTGITVYGILYKNGSALGSTRSTLSTTGVTFTEGPYTNIAAGDEFQIYARTSDPSGAAGVWDLQICFTPSSAVALYSAIS